MWSSWPLPDKKLEFGGRGGLTSTELCDLRAVFYKTISIDYIYIYIEREREREREEKILLYCGYFFIAFKMNGNNIKLFFLFLVTTQFAVTIGSSLINFFVIL